MNSVGDPSGIKETSPDMLSTLLKNKAAASYCRVNQRVI